MGMYDTIVCEYPLSDCDIVEFQTKDLQNFLMTYTITKEGRLIAEEFEYEIIPEQERPYYGTDKWEDNSLFKVFGSIRKINIRDVDTEYHGDLTMYTHDKDNNWVEFKLRFTEGVVSKVGRI